MCVSFGEVRGQTPIQWPYQFMQIDCFARACSEVVIGGEIDHTTHPHTHALLKIPGRFKIALSVQPALVVVAIAGVCLSQGQLP